MSDDPAPEELTALRAAFAGHDLGPPLGWHRVAEFESQCGVVLPEPYRSFVATIGDGCTDGPPHYGLAALGQDVNEQVRFEPERLARPFPLTAQWIWENDPDPDEARYHAVWGDGLLWLGTEGCSMYWALVISGEHRGHIWDVADVGAQPYGQPFGYTSAEPGFGGWVARWATGADWYNAA